MSYRNADIIAAITSFDKDLLFSIRTSPRISIYLRDMELMNWIEKGEISTKSRVASTLLANLIIRYSDSLLTSEGKERVRTIAKNLHRFEGLIEQIRTNFVRKIYRDHLNHMIRTTLLALNIASLIQFPSQKFKSLALASLFHDIAYPVQEAGTLFEQVVDALGEGYVLPQLENQKLSFGYPKYFALLAKKVGIDDSILMEYYQDNVNHAVVGAFEFLECCTHKRKLKKSKDIPQEAIEIATTICLHDLNEEFRFIDNPLAAILIIADEMQDWGRPVSQPNGEKPIPLAKIFNFFEKSRRIRPSNISLPKGHPRWEIADKLAIDKVISEGWEKTEKWKEYPKLVFKLNKEKKQLKPAQIAGEMRYKGKSFPLLDVVYSKYQNLKRINFQDFPLDFALDFPLKEIKPKESELQITDLYDSEKTGIHVFPKTRKNPWGIKPIKLSNEEISDLTGLEINELKIARIALQHGVLGPHQGDISPILFKFGDSHNYLVSNGKPNRMAIVRKFPKTNYCIIEMQFEFWYKLVRRQYDRVMGSSYLYEKYESVSAFGDLIHTNRVPRGIRQPRILKPIQTVLRLMQLRENHYEPLQIPAKVFWFRPQRINLPKKSAEHFSIGTIHTRT